MVWHSHLFKNFSQIAVICTVKGFRVVNEAEVDIFKESPCFLCDPVLAVLSLVPLPFLIQLVNLEFLGSHTAET